jgi:hypothetical protein
MNWLCGLLSHLAVAKWGLNPLMLELLECTPYCLTWKKATWGIFLSHTSTPHIAILTHVAKMQHGVHTRN